MSGASVRLVSCTRRACSRSPLGPPSCPRWRPACGARPAGARREPRACRGYQPGQWPPRPRPALRGPALTQERPDAQEEEQRCTALAESRGARPARRRQASWGFAGGLACTGPQHTARPADQSTSLGAQRAAKPPPRGGWGVTGSSGTGRAQRRRCLPLCPCGGRIGKARRSVCSSALPRRRGARTWPGSPAARGGCPAVAPYQRLHRPVRGRLRRQAYLVDHSCASRCCPPRPAAALGGVGWKTAPRCGRAPVPRAMLVQRHGRARRSGTAVPDTPSADGTGCLTRRRLEG